MSDPKVFTSSVLPCGRTATVIEGNGAHYFNAMRLAKGDSSQIFKYLILELISIDGEQLTEQELEQMHIKDIIHLNEMITLMATP